MSARSALSVLTRVVALFGLTLVLASAWQQDWTYDEPFHMQWARRLLVERVSERRSDPLWNSKTPVMIAHVLSKEAGRNLGAKDGRALAFWARLPGVLTYLATLLLAYRFARARLGEAAGRLAVLGLALDPSLIANAAVATVDAPYTLATLAVLVLGVRFAEQPSLPRAAAVGAALGLAFATKFTAFLLLPGLLLLLPCYGLARLGGWRRVGRATLVVALVALVTVNVAYLFVGLFVPLGPIVWKSAPMLRLAATLPLLRLPLPIDFLTGLDICFAHERQRGWAVLILDRSFPNGVWFYFLVSWALKTPLLLLAAQVAGLISLARQGHRQQQQPLVRFLVANLLLALVYFSWLFRAQIGYRYLLMGLPLLALLVAHAFVNLPTTRLAAGAALVSLASVVELLPYWGNALAFTNPLVQPKTHAFHYLTNSSIDWGQNDERIQPWIAEQVRLGRFGTQPVWFEPTHMRPGVNVIGLNSLAGAANYAQHRFLRTQREPEGHFRYTYVWFTIDDATYQQFLDKDRTLMTRSEDHALCAPGADLAPVEAHAFTRFPEPPEGANAWIVCVDVPQGADLEVRAERAGLLLGRAGGLTREWDALRAGERLAYRLKPGVHALATIKMQLFSGRFAFERGRGQLAIRPARLRKRGALEILAPRPVPPAPEDAEKEDHSV